MRAASLTNECKKLSKRASVCQKHKGALLAALPPFLFFFYLWLYCRSIQSDFLARAKKVGERERKEGPILKVSHQLKPIHHVESIRPIKTCPMSKNVLSISSYLDRWRFLRSYRLEKIHFGKNLKSLSKTGFQTKKQTQKAQKIRSLQLH